MELAGARVLVTGGDGFIGSHVVERLVGLGAEVTALSQYNSFDRSGWIDDIGLNVRRSIEVIQGDVRDGDHMRRLAKGKNAILHLAALIGIPYSYESSRSYVDVNVMGTLNILEAARMHDVEKVVHTSTSEVYGTARYEPIDESHPITPQSPYSASKIGADALAESYARSFEMPVFIIRPFNTYGPRQSERAVVPTIMRQVLDPNVSEVRIGSLDPRRDLVFVEDTAGAFCDLAASSRAVPGRPYNAGTGHSVTIGELLGDIMRLASSEKPVVQENARRRPERSEVMALVADAKSFYDATNWQPKFDLNKGLSKTLTWWRRRIEAGAVRTDSGYAV